MNWTTQSDSRNTEFEAEIMWPAIMSNFSYTKAVFHSLQTGSILKKDSIPMAFILISQITM